MSKAYIGIGSNLGNRQENIDKALEKLKARKNIQLNEVSPVIETEPVGDIEQPKFLNTCCSIDTTLYPDELLSALKSIERELGRDRDSMPRKLSIEEQLKDLEEDKDITRTAKEGGSSGLSGQKKEKGPRVIDLDILLYDDIIMKGNNLVIPHKSLHERIFVLEPLSQIAPGIMHPVLKKTIKDLLLYCQEKDLARRSRRDKPNLSLKEFDNDIKVPVVAHPQPNFSRTLLGIICKLLNIPYPKLKAPETETENEVH